MERFLAFFVAFVFGAVTTFLVITFYLKQAEPRWCDKCDKFNWMTKWRWQKGWKCMICKRINQEN